MFSRLMRIRLLALAGPRRNRITAGVFMENVTEWTSWSYSASTSAFPVNQSVTALFHEQRPMGS